jgi:hypothetical protein
MFKPLSRGVHRLGPRSGRYDRNPRYRIALEEGEYTVLEKSGNCGEYVRGRYPTRVLAVARIIELLNNNRWTQARITHWEEPK